MGTETDKLSKPHTLLEIANQAIAESGLVIQLGVKEELTFKDGRYYGDNPVAVFQLLDAGTIVAEEHDWNSLLAKIKQEYGEKFMRKAGLDVLFVKRQEKEEEKPKSTSSYRRHH